MGHTRLGAIPKLRKWGDIVSTFAREAPAPLSSDDVNDVARRTLEAAEPALRRAVDDPGLRQAFFLLAKVALAARQKDWKGGLQEIGVCLPPEAGLFDLTSELHASVDTAIQAAGAPSDVSEMAQAALGEALVELVAPRATTLFGGNDENLRSALREVSTRKTFGELGQRFFGHFLARFLNFYLSRITAGETGGGAVQQIGDLSRFNRQLDNHCIQSAKIVESFCGEWYSKTEYLEGINTENTHRFIAIALRKLSAEIRRQGIDQ